MDEIVIIKIIGNNILFANEITYFNTFYPIEFLKLDYNGIIKEFPDLIDVPVDVARKEATIRFKEHIKKIENENGIKDYLVKEFEGMGYTLACIRRDGFREVKLN